MADGDQLSYHAGPDLGLSVGPSQHLPQLKTAETHEGSSHGEGTKAIGSP